MVQDVLYFSDNELKTFLTEKRYEFKQALAKSVLEELVKRKLLTENEKQQILDADAALYARGKTMVKCSRQFALSLLLVIIGFLIDNPGVGALIIIFGGILLFSATVGIFTNRIRLSYLKYFNLKFL